MAEQEAEGHLQKVWQLAEVPFWEVPLLTWVDSVKFPEAASALDQAVAPALRVEVPSWGGL